MEQFNLAGYLKNPDRKLVTRDGARQESFVLIETVSVTQ